MSALDNPTEESYMTVEFSYGSPIKFARYTDRVTDVQGGDFTAKPEMKITLPDNTGVFDQKVLRVVLPLVTADVVDTFLDRLSDGLPHAPIAVIVREIIKPLLGSEAADILDVFRGSVTRSVRNYQGRADTIAIEASPARARLKASMGMPCNHHCTFNMFGRGCSTGDGLGGAEPDGTPASGPQRGDELALVVISAINGKEVTATPPAKSDDRHWHRGYMEFDGLRIGIRDFDASVATDKFQLVNRPPATWSGEQVVLVPGCDKTIEICRTRWANEEHFGGFGYAIPPYNPLVESPS